MEIIDDSGVKKPERSAFLTLICLLMWLGCLATIGVSSTIYIMLYGRADVYNEGYYPEEGDRLRFLQFSSIVFIGAALLSLIGTVGMWMLRRRGFYTYLAGQLVSLSLLGYLIARWRTVRFDAMEMLVILVTFGLPVCFIVLFSLNLKRMRGPNK